MVDYCRQGMEAFENERKLRLKEQHEANKRFAKIKAAWEELKATEEADYWGMGDLPEDFAKAMEKLEALLNA